MGRYTAKPSIYDVAMSKTDNQQVGTKLISTIRKALRLFMDVAHGESYIIFILMFLVAALEMIGIGLIIPLIHVGFYQNANEMGGGAVVASFLQLFQSTPTELVAVIFATTFLIKNLCIVGTTYYINTKMFKYWSISVRQLFYNYVKRDISYHANKNSAFLIRNLNTGVFEAFWAIQQVFMVFLELFLLIAAVVTLLLIEPVLTLIMAGIMGSVSLVYFVIVAPYFRRWGQFRIAREADMIKCISQSFSNLTFAKLRGKETEMAKALETLSDQRSIYEGRLATSIHIPRNLLETIAVISLIAIIGFLIESGRAHADIVTTIGVFGMATLRLLPSMNRCLSSLSDLPQRAAFVEEIHADLYQEAPESADEQSVGPPVVFEKEFSVQNVCFTYEGANNPALNQINITIRKGEVIGLVGPSGAGKTTLLNVILGLTRPSHGIVSVDGKLIFEHLSGWHNLIGYVPQEVSLLDETLERNITFELADGKISLERITKAIELAKLDDVLKILPDGLNAKPGEAGRRLSGGQRQRIAIARALYQDPPFLIFDEATAALDSESENEVSLAIKELTTEKTMLIVSHRLSTIRHCNRILYMEAGRIIDTGPFEDLYKRCKPFQDLVKLGDLEVK